MKKIIILLLVLMGSVQVGFAQFEKGKVYVGGAIDGAGFSYDSTNKFSISLGARVGYMFANEWMVIGDATFQYQNSDVMTAKIGAAARYYIKQNGLFLQAGAHYVHEFSDFNSLQLNPEVGYSFFLGEHAVIEPSVYYDMSLNKFSDRSRVGLKVNFVVYFDTLKKL